VTIEATFEAKSVKKVMGGIVLGILRNLPSAHNGPSAGAGRAFDRRYRPVEGERD
jgi:hypothetical protein